MFESIKHVDELGFEYWEARKLMLVLGYNKWENFHKVIKNAMIACDNTGISVLEHFPEVRKTIDMPKNASKDIKDYKLSRYACYLIAQNGDSRKKTIALAQTYFAIQTRKMEISEKEYSKLTEDEKRLYQRSLTRKGNSSLNQVAKKSGVKNFDKFHNYGYKGLYNELTADDIAKRKGLRYREDILDNMGSDELIINLFRISQMEQKLQKDNIKTEKNANITHYKVGSKIIKVITKLVKKIMINNIMIEEITKLVNQVKNNLAKEINKSIIYVYWNIGKIIVSNEKQYNSRMEYGKEVLKCLSNELTKYLGKGYSYTSLKYMRLFYKIYPDYSKISEKLTWTHYCELIIIKDNDKRYFYEKECVNSRWSVRELKRQLNTSLFERLLLSNGKLNKEKVLELTTNGQNINKPSDLIKEPYVFEFLGIKENKPVLEKDLEYKLIKHIECFLLELGKGFMFVGSQQRITLNNTDYYVDMVFYNKFLKSYVLIDLKMDKLKAENFGQMNLYLNYYEKVVNNEDDGKPIGIILCAEKDNIMLEFALGGLSNNIFASTYTYYIPNKEELINEVEKVLNE